MSDIVSKHISTYSFNDNVKDAFTVMDTNNIDIMERLIQSDSS